MAGLLDFIQTPAGIGLLSAVAGGMAGARRNTPWNNAGRAGLAGLTGYAQANDQIRQDKEKQLADQYRQMQIDEIKRKQADRDAYRAQFKPAGQADFQADNPFGEDLGTLKTETPPMFAGQAIDPKLAAIAPFLDPKEMYSAITPKEADKPQLVTVYDNGQPVQKWLRPGEAEGVQVGMGKPEAEAYKERTVSPDGRQYIKQYSQDGGKTWQQIEGTQPYDIRAASGSSDISVNAFPKETFKNERDLRNDFQGLPTTKAYREVQNSYDQINFALKNPSAANDLAAATKFMKLLDPGSVVRESELGMAMAATGQLDRMSNYYTMLKTGQKLTPSQRADFHKSAQGLYEAATGRYNQSADEYRTMAQDYQLNPDRIAKPAAAEKPEAPPVKPAAAQSFALPPNAKQYEGKTIRDTKTGKRFQAKGGRWTEIK